MSFTLDDLLDELKLSVEQITIDHVIEAMQEILIYYKENHNNHGTNEHKQFVDRVIDKLIDKMSEVYEGELK
jgi:DNA-binding IscR family transcriptional regulator